MAKNQYMQGIKITEKEESSLPCYSPCVCLYVYLYIFILDHPDYFN